MILTLLPVARFLSLLATTARRTAVCARTLASHPARKVEVLYLFGGSLRAHERTFLLHILELRLCLRVHCSMSAISLCFCNDNPVFDVLFSMRYGSPKIIAAETNAMSIMGLFTKLIMLKPPRGW